MENTYASALIASGTMANEIRQPMLYAVDRLTEMEVFLRGLTFSSGEHVDLLLPLVDTLNGCDHINLGFGLWHRSDLQRGEPYVTCGPSHSACDKESIDGYMDWLSPYMPRRGMNKRDVLEQGNPDSLLLTLDGGFFAG